MTTTPRTAQEILIRIAEIRDADMFGTREHDLLRALPWEDVKDLVSTQCTEQLWTQSNSVAEATEYLPFAMGKASNHRGLSAARSIDHYREWAWLSGQQAFMDALDLPYNYYGAPILHAVAEAIGAQKVWAEHVTPELATMARGDRCAYCTD